jgi:hypothetical protein
MSSHRLARTPQELALEILGLSSPDGSARRR